MRPVNLIPPNARGAAQAAMRTGAVAYVLLAALGLLLLGVVAITLAGKQKDDKQAQVAALEQELQAKTAKAESLSAFAEFGAVEQMRASTISSLAQSRFDWERVMNELALVLPSDVWLVQLSGTVNPAVQLEEAPEIEIRDSVPGPALEIVGCAPGQDSVAAFAADLEDIDGVTRVGVSSSGKADEEATAAAATETTSGSDDSNVECRTRDFINRFEIVVAFDAVPVPGAATADPTVPAPLAPGTEGSDVQAQNAANQAAVSEASNEAQQATNVLPGG